MSVNRHETVDINIVAVVKGAERYLITYEQSPAGRAAALRQLGVWASNDELSFTWHDAAVLSQKVRAGA